jgi:hypothetical protein
MGSPLSGIIAEIFLQHLEDSHIKPLLESKCIAFYSRYVDDIIIIYDATCTDPEAIVQHANSIHSNLQLAPTLESNNQIRFLDLLITRKAHQLESDVYHKPTTTDTTINYLSNHPTEPKLATYGYYIERMQNLPLNRTRQLGEWQTILHLATSNNFPSTLLHKLKQQRQCRLAKPPPTTNSENNTKWATFTYSSLRVRKITNLFKHTNVKNQFQMPQHNSTTHHASHQPQHPSPRQRGILPINLKIMQPLICRSNQPEPKDPLPRAHQIHKN